MRDSSAMQLLISGAVIVMAMLLASCSQQSNHSPHQMEEKGRLASTAADVEPPGTDHGSAAAQVLPHTDHESKRGGTFFMALDNRHHLEGVLQSPGIFRVYLYNDRSQPVGASQLARTQATVVWGEQDGAPEIDLKPSPDGTVLEAKAPGPVRFPVTLTLLVRFPGAPPDARRELFTFPFSDYSHPLP